MALATLSGGWVCHPPAKAMLAHAALSKDLPAEPGIQEVCVEAHIHPLPVQAAIANL